MSSINRINKIIAENSIDEIAMRELSEDITSEDFASDTSLDQTEDGDKSATNDQKTLIINYLKIDDAIKKKMETVKELKNQKKECEKNLLCTLDDDIGSIYLGKNVGTLRKNVSRSKDGLKLKFIREVLDKKITDKKILQEIMEELDNRPVTERVYIKRINPRTANK